jgi:hypothetical protein
MNTEKSKMVKVDSGVPRDVLFRLRFCEDQGFGRLYLEPAALCRDLGHPHSSLTKNVLLETIQQEQPFLPVLSTV